MKMNNAILYQMSVKLGNETILEATLFTCRNDDRLWSEVWETFACTA